MKTPPLTSPPTTREITHMMTRHSEYVDVIKQLNEGSTTEPLLLVEGLIEEVLSIPSNYDVTIEDEDALTEAVIEWAGGIMADVYTHALETRLPLFSQWTREALEQLDSVQDLDQLLTMGQTLFYQEFAMKVFEFIKNPIITVEDLPF